LILPVITPLLAVLCWPKGILLFFPQWSNFAVFNSSGLTFLAFIMIISYLLLRKFTSLSLLSRIISIIVVLSLLLEWYFLFVNASLTTIHTLFCWVPPETVYIPWKIAPLIAIIGGGCLTAALLDPKIRCDYLSTSSTQEDLTMAVEKRTPFLCQATSIPILLGLFHSTFFINSIVGSIGCNPVPMNLLSMTAIPWLIASSSIYIHRFDNKLLTFPYLLLNVFLVLQTAIMYFPVLLGYESMYNSIICNNQALFDIFTGGMIIILSFIPFIIIISKEFTSRTSL